jgi:UDP-N-acetylmuramoylalanine--D-glutamate ligase
MRFSELEGKRIGVWGAGREIGSFATQLAKRCPAAQIATVAVDDPSDRRAQELASSHRAPLLVGAEALDALGRCDLVVRSPGVSIYRPELRELRKRDVYVTTATSLWLAEREGRNTIGVSGTKGKSTTAALIAHLARAAGYEANLAGNIGAPALDLLDSPDSELAIVELSSYQIADLQVGPQIAVMTNLYREHADWHGSFEAYRADKLRLLELPGVRMSVLNGRDPELLAVRGEEPESSLFGVPEGWDVSAGAITHAGVPVVGLSELPLKGEHNAMNLCAALGALAAYGAPQPRLPEALRGFVALPHRLETVHDSGGILWIDDSISTTPESTLAALASFREREIVLLAGGEDRGQEYEQLGRELAAREAIVIGLPVTGARLVQAARNAGLSASRAVQAQDMPDAVRLARTLARPGSAVLLSPAAPSYNAYRDFEQRGAHFRSLVAA